MAAVFVRFHCIPDVHYLQQNNEAYAATNWITEHARIAFFCQPPSERAGPVKNIVLAHEVFKHRKMTG